MDDQAEPEVQSELKSGLLLNGILRLVATSHRHLGTVCESCQKTLTSQRRTVSSTSRLLGVFGPTDLSEGPDIPEYEVLNVQMKGHDYVILESYVKYVHNLAHRLGLDTEMFAMPTRSNHIDTYKVNSSIVENTYDLHTFDRTLQLQDVPSTTLPLFLEVIRSHLPQGITITVKELDADEEEFRYIPDIQLHGLRSQIDDIQQAREDRRKK